MEYKTESVEQTEDFGAQMAARARAGDVFCLAGEMGAGKTAFARGFARGLGCADAASSPTFAIINEYPGGSLPLYHFDVYRIENILEMEDTGYEEYFYGGGVCLIEWADLISDIIPDNAVWVRIRRVGDNERVFELS
ncbi:MAG: tRNA (adenosine(37)-N6)-threonylcarbamoyltransferase complex ATPase subunit type 1 TsaE [Defluviitaleaceae bacterium]|nr:tRNA (adenosine(37)-N6)-threonylcarbamoyltransferase complex ATPase subunit type 1 TsaE [Defluviitaleaceae bacterium]